MNPHNPQRKLPTELIFEIANFSPGNFCKKRLIANTSLFYLLLHKTKRAKFWQSKNDEAREQGAQYTYNGQTYLALLPRNDAHHNLSRMMWDFQDLTNYIVDETNEDNIGGRSIFISLRVLTQAQRNALRIFFHANQGHISDVYHCEFVFVELPPQEGVSWDLGEASFDNSEEFANWPELMNYLYGVITTIESGNQPEAPIAPVSSTSSSSDEAEDE